MPVNTARTENSVQVTPTVTSLKDRTSVPSNHPFFHPSSNPTRKATIIAELVFMSALKRGGARFDMADSFNSSCA